VEKISINFRVNEIELLNTFSWRKKVIDRAIKIEILDKSSGQEHPKGSRLIIIYFASSTPKYRNEIIY
jgi:hypothetical protein